MLNKIKNAILNHNYIASLMQVGGLLLMLGSMVYIAAVMPSVHSNYIDSKVGRVVIKVVRDNTAMSGGTGFHVKAKSGKTYILTNGHVCAISDDGKEALIQVPGSERFVKRKIIEIFTKHDLCLIEALDSFTGVELASKVEVGEEVRVVGHPFLLPLRGAQGVYIQDTPITVAIGEVGSEEMPSEKFCKNQNGYVKEERGFFGSVTLCLRDLVSMETNITIYPGNSGSPAVNFWGNVVGVAFAGDSETNYGFLVPLPVVQDFLSIY